MSAAPRTVALVGGPRDGESIVVHDGMGSISVADDYGAGDYICLTPERATWRGYWHRFGYIDFGPVPQP